MEYEFREAEDLLLSTNTEKVWNNYAYQGTLTLSQPFPEPVS